MTKKLLYNNQLQKNRQEDGEAEKNNSGETEAE